ncbi:MAG: ABC transporter substrate-binding protein [Lachnospiraceae bacterium]
MKVSRSDHKKVSKSRKCIALGCVLLLLSLMTIGMSACGSKEASSAQSSETLTVGIWDTAQEPGLKEIMADFTEETGVKVKIEVTPWEQYWTMLEAAATGGDLPDVFWMHANEVQKYAESGMLADVSEQLETLGAENFPEGLTELYTNSDGASIGIPKDVDTVALWYNKTLFDEAGIAYPDESWTWETFRENAEKLTNQDAGRYGCYFRADSGQETYFNVIYDYGGYVINEDRTKSGYDNANTIEAMTYVESLKAFMPPYEMMADNSNEALFNSGKVAMGLFGSWMTRGLLENEYVAENCEIAVLPMYEDTRKSIYNGLAWSVSANSANQENAKELVAYLGSQEAQEKQADLGVTMSAYQDTSEGFVNLAPEKNLQAYIDMMEDEVMLPYSKNATVWLNYTAEELSKQYAGEQTMADALHNITVFMNQALSEE